MARLADSVSKAGGAMGLGIDVDSLLPLLEIEREALTQNLESANKQLDKQLQDFQKLDRETSDLENQESQLDDLRLDHQANRLPAQLVEHRIGS